jgi:hypothetical protein
MDKTPTSSSIDDEKQPAKEQPGNAPRRGWGLRGWRSKDTATEKHDKELEKSDPKKPDESDPKPDEDSAQKRTEATLPSDGAEAKDQETEVMSSSLEQSKSDENTTPTDSAESKGWFSRRGAKEEIDPQATTNNDFSNASKNKIEKDEPNTDPEEEAKTTARSGWFIRRVLKGTSETATEEVVEASGDTGVEDEPIAVTAENATSSRGGWFSKRNHTDQKEAEVEHIEELAESASKKMAEPDAKSLVDEEAMIADDKPFAKNIAGKGESVIQMVAATK